VLSSCSQHTLGDRMQHQFRCRLHTLRATVPKVARGTARSRPSPASSGSPAGDAPSPFAPSEWGGPWTCARGYNAVKRVPVVFRAQRSEIWSTRARPRGGAVEPETAIRRLKEARTLGSWWLDCPSPQASPAQLCWSPFPLLSSLPPGAIFLLFTRHRSWFEELFSPDRDSRLNIPEYHSYPLAPEPLDISSRPISRARSSPLETRSCPFTAVTRSP